MFLIKAPNSDLLDLVRRLNDDQAAIGSGDGALDQNDVVFGIDVDDVEVADRHLFGAVVAGHFLALLGTAETSVRGQVRTTDRAVNLFHAVAGAQALEVPALHGAGETAALARADHVDALGILENFRDGELVADLVFGRRFFKAEFADVLLGFAIGLGGQRDASGEALATLRFQTIGDVTAFRADGSFAGLVFVADLDRFVAIDFDGADLQDRAGTSLDHRHRRRFALFIVNLSHADFSAENTLRHGTHLADINECPPS